MKRIVLVVTFGGLALACGGGGGSGGGSFVDPDSVRFEYTSYSDASGSTLTAAQAGEAGAGDTLALADAADESDATSLINLPDSMAGDAFESTTPAVQAAAGARVAMSRRAAAYAVGDLETAATGWDDPTCVTITATSITYKGCKGTATTILGSVTITADGSLTRGLTAVDWDVTASWATTIKDTEGDITIQGSSRFVGQISVSETSSDRWSVAGVARSESQVSVSGQGKSASEAYTHNADIRLDYQPSIECVVDGTIELKRVWALRPSGATSADLPDVGVMFDWNGCGSVQVSWGVLK